MAPDSINTTWRRDRRQRPPLSPAAAARRRGLHRRLGARLYRARRRGRPCAVVRQGPDARHQPAGRLRRAELHQSQQPFHRHRPAACRARHLRQLLPRSRHGQGGDDERSEVPAGRDAVPGLPARRLPHRRHHRQGQAARAFGQGAGAGRRQGLQFLVGEVRQGQPGRERHRQGQHAGRHGRAGRLQRRPVGVRLRRRRQADGARAAADHVSLDHRLHPAQARARHAGRQRLLRHDGRLHGQARCAWAARSCSPPTTA